MMDGFPGQNVCAFSNINTGIGGQVKIAMKILSTPGVQIIATEVRESDITFATEDDIEMTGKSFRIESG
ncbi:MAG: hypothetical protein NTY86_09615, partial [Deltaproteobacteria bacterium]|nr:hypothetical protein [Deltaproteobacteria bacterium]